MNAPGPAPLVTVIVPCRNEEHYIAACLDSIVATRHPLDRLEVIVVDGASDDRTRAIVADYTARYPCMRLLDNPRRITPAAMNIGIRAAHGSVVIRMDAHAFYPPEYVPGLVAALEASGADNVGGRMITVPGGPGPTARAIAHALAHPFGVGNSRFRIGVKQPRWVDTVQFGCYRSDVFTRIGLFDEDLVRNQDDEFNYRLIRHGGRVLLTPDVELSYFGRTSLGKLWRMFYQYGRFKPLVAKKIGRIMTVRQLVPTAFLLCLAVAGAISLFWPPAALAGAALLGAYLALDLSSSLGSLRKVGLRGALALFAAFPTLHLAYGWGFLLGCGDLIVTRRRSRLEPAALPLSR